MLPIEYAAVCKHIMLLFALLHSLASQPCFTALLHSLASQPHWKLAGAGAYDMSELKALLTTNDHLKRVSSIGILALIQT